MRTQTSSSSEILEHQTQSILSDALLPDTKRASGEVTSFQEEAPAQVLAERDQLILQHLPIVRFVARRIQERVPQSVELDDLVSAGVLGLIDAASKFDQSRQVQFKSYAQFRIRGAIMDSLRSLDWSPRELRRKSRAMAEAIRTLSAQLGRTPTDAEIADEMSMDLLSFQQMTGELDGLEVGSLQVERTEESDESVLDFVQAPADQCPLASCIDRQERSRISAALEVLPEKERLVLSLSYFEGMTMREIGFLLGVGESRVSQIRTSGIAKLRKQLLGPSKPRARASK